MGKRSIAGNPSKCVVMRISYFDGSHNHIISGMSLFKVIGHNKSAIANNDEFRVKSSRILTAFKHWGVFVVFSRKFLRLDEKIF